MSGPASGDLDLAHYRALFVVADRHKPAFNKLNSVICIALSLGVLFLVSGGLFVKGTKI